jgi:hypothetical protein
MSSLYDNARNMFARGDLKWKATAGSTIRAFMVDRDGYTPSQSAHVYLSSIPSSARKGNLGGNQLSDAPRLVLEDPIAGVCDAADITFVAIPPGTTLGYLVLFEDTGDENTSSLIAVIDRAAGLPVNSNGADMDIRWSNGPSKIFKL